MTSQPELNPVQWRRRCFNRIADHIANYTMDIQRSWCQKFIPPVDNVSVQKANFVIHTDGGTRANKCSSSAWYVEAHVQLPSGTASFPICMAGRFISTPISSFTAEAIALEEAVDLIWELLRT